jgi:hypothetical protein
VLKIGRVCGGLCLLLLIKVSIPAIPNKEPIAVPVTINGMLFEFVLEPSSGVLVGLTALVVELTVFLVEPTELVVELTVFLVEPTELVVELTVFLVEPTVSVVKDDGELDVELTIFSVKLAVELTIFSVKLAVELTIFSVKLAVELTIFSVKLAVELTIFSGISKIFTPGKVKFL